MLLKTVFIIYISIIKNVFSEEINRIEPELKGFYNSFYHEALESKTLDSNLLKRLKNVSIQYVNRENISSYFIAECDHKNNIVSVNKEIFQTRPKEHQQEVIDHELGHCVLLRSHYNESILTSFGEIPTNIMHHTTFAYKNEEDMKKMRKDLFNPKFYGTFLEVYSLLKNKDMEINTSSIQTELDSIYELRKTEHLVMQKRINKHKQKK